MYIGIFCRMPVKTSSVIVTSLALGAFISNLFLPVQMHEYMGIMNIERGNQPHSSKILLTPCAHVFGPPKLPLSLWVPNTILNYYSSTSSFAMFLFVACFSSSVATGAKRGRWKDAGGRMAAKKNGCCRGRWEWCRCCFVKRDSNRISKVIYNQGRSGW